MLSVNTVIAIGFLAAAAIIALMAFLAGEARNKLLQAVIAGCFIAAGIVGIRSYGYGFSANDFVVLVLIVVAVGVLTACAVGAWESRLHGDSPPASSPHENLNPF